MSRDAPLVMQGQHYRYLLADFTEHTQIKIITMQVMQVENVGFLRWYTEQLK